MDPIKISIIITTYNRSPALELVLRALSCQDDNAFEVVIADDGSTEATRELLNQLNHELSFPIQHVWQQDEGFRAAMIRNKAVIKSSGDYLLFLDGDCVPPVNFVRRHRCLAEKEWLVGGNRVLLNQALTTQVTKRLQPIQFFSWFDWLRARLKGRINRLLPLCYLPLGVLRKLNGWQWKGAKTCNLGVWKTDFLSVNGFDESYQGWGHEDSDLVIRLIRAGIKRKIGKFAVPVFHLWHLQASQAQQPENYQRLKAVQLADETQAKRGLDQYIT